MQFILAIHNLLFLLKFQLQSAFVRNSLHSRFSSRQGGVLPCLVHLVRAVLVLWRKIYPVKDNCIRITPDSNHRRSEPSDVLPLLRIGVCWSWTYLLFSPLLLSLAVWPYFSSCLTSALNNIHIFQLRDHFKWEVVVVRSI